MTEDTRVFSAAKRKRSASPTGSIYLHKYHVYTTYQYIIIISTQVYVCICFLLARPPVERVTCRRTLLASRAAAGAFRAEAWRAGHVNEPLGPLLALAAGSATSFGELFAQAAKLALTPS